MYFFLKNLITAQSNEEDWAARARAWADAKTAMESQQSQFAPTGRPEEQNYYHDQYSQPMNSNHPDMSHQPLPPSIYDQFSASATSVGRPPAAHHLESTPVTVSSEHSSYPSDGRPTYTVGDVSYGGNMNSSLHHQGKLSSSPSVHQQEVPSSNYSVTGNDSLVYMSVVIPEESCFQTHLLMKQKFFLYQYHQPPQLSFLLGKRKNSLLGDYLAEWRFFWVLLLVIVCSHWLFVDIYYELCYFLPLYCCC